MIRLVQPTGVIANVSLHLLYLIFKCLLRWLTLLGPHLRVPRTVTRPLISAFAGQPTELAATRRRARRHISTCAADRPRRHIPRPAQHDRQLWPFDSPT
jgi:hypothetical protein